MAVLVKNCITHIGWCILKWKSEIINPQSVQLVNNKCIYAINSSTFIAWGESDYVMYYYKGWS